MRKNTLIISVLLIITGLANFTIFSQETKPDNTSPDGKYKSYKWLRNKIGLYDLGPIWDGEFHYTDKNDPVDSQYMGMGSGNGSGTKPREWQPYYYRLSNCANENSNFTQPQSIGYVENRPLRIGLAPQPLYSQEAQEKSIQGIVKLKVEFLSNGRIGKIIPTVKLPYGLTESAMRAACFMTFIPTIKNHNYVNTSADVHYEFKLVNNSPSTKTTFLAQPSNTESDSINVVIISKPPAQYTIEGRQNRIEGTVILSVTFLVSGQIGKILPLVKLPYGLTEKAIEAARKIKFEPAKKNGKPYTATEEIKYNFVIR
jgi:hypothetical protein